MSTPLPAALGAVELIVVGASWGGLDAIGSLLELLSAELTPAIAAVLHRGPSPPSGTVEAALQRRSPLPVREAEDKDDVVGGCVLVAPADYHLMVERGHFELSVDAPVASSRPSIDVLFESAAEAYGPAVVGVVLTGANADGAAGLQRIRERGGMTLVQDPATAERREMPEAAIATGAVDHVLTIPAIAAVLNEAGGR